MRSIVPAFEGTEIPMAESPCFLQEKETPAQCTAYRPTTSRIFAYSSLGALKALCRDGIL